MNFKDIFNIIKIDNKYKKKSYSLIIIISVLLIMLFFILVFNHTIVNYINNLQHRSYLNRTIIVDGQINEKDIEKLQFNKTILAINKQNVASIVIGTNEYEEIVLFPIDENNGPELIMGQMELQNGGLICPKDFIPKANIATDFNITMDNVIDGKKILNKKFNVKIVNRQINNNTIETVDTYDKAFRIVGIYDSKEYMMDNNICFISYNDFNEIYDFLYDTPSFSNTQILVDDFQNVASIVDSLNSMGYNAYPMMLLDFESISLIFFISCLSLLGFGALIYVTISFNIKRELCKCEKEILLYKSIGYSNKDIIKIYYFKNIWRCVVATLVSILASLFILQIVEHYVLNIVALQLIKITYNWFEVLILFLFGIFFPSIIILKKIQKVVLKEKIK